jgi:hypothetical protein
MDKEINPYESKLDMTLTEYLNETIPNSEENLEQCLLDRLTKDRTGCNKHFENAIDRLILEKILLKWKRINKEKIYNALSDEEKKEIDQQEIEYKEQFAKNCKEFLEYERRKQSRRNAAMLR